MSVLNEYFDKIIYINAKLRFDRFRRMNRRFKELGMVAEKQEAFMPGTMKKIPLEVRQTRTRDKGKAFLLNNGEIGCFLSHRAIYDKIKLNGWQKTLILEDDALFVKGFEDKFKKIVESVNQNNYIWDMLYLGQCNYDNNYRGDCERSKIKQFSSELWEAKRCWLTHAYAVNLNCIDFLLQKTEVIYAGIDEVLCDAQEEGELKVLAAFPDLIVQDSSKSMIY